VCVCACVWCVWCVCCVRACGCVLCVCILYIYITPYIDKYSNVHTQMYIHIHYIYVYLVRPQNMFYVTFWRVRRRRAYLYINTHTHTERTCSVSHFALLWMRPNSNKCRESGEEADDGWGGGGRAYTHTHSHQKHSQKRPTRVSKETFYSVKRDLLQRHAPIRNFHTSVP
jgi:hypothetical protein